VVIVRSFLALAVVNAGIVVFTVPERGNGFDPVFAKPFVKIIPRLLAHDAVRRLLVEALIRVFRFPDASFYAYQFNGIVLKILDRLVRLFAEEAVVGTFQFFWTAFWELNCAPGC
jgi:hypothetical protein